MKQRIKSFVQEIGIMSLALTIAFISYMGIAFVKGWTDPTVAPPGGNLGAPINTSNMGQTKAGGLILNTGGAADGLIVDKGNVGIGTQTPNAIAPNGQGSNVDVNDFYIRSIGKWASELGNIELNAACGCSKLGCTSSIIYGKISSGKKNVRIQSSGWCGPSFICCDSGWVVGSTASCTGSIGGTHTVTMTDTSLSGSGPYDSCSVYFK